MPCGGKKKRKKSKSKIIQTRKRVFYTLITLLVLANLIIVGIIRKTSVTEDVKLTINYSSEQIITGDEGAYTEEIPTIDEIDGGGKFQDTLATHDGTSGFYYELGSIEEVDTSSPTAFKNSTLGRCIVANNYYGAQCVSLARAFWWDYAGFDITTCGTGLAKGMMNCAEDNARDKFKIIWNIDEIQEGTWIVLDGSRTGHICMALGKVNNGYVSCLGENQGGVPCDYGVGGAGTNIVNLSVKNFIGGYTPLNYIIPEPEPEPVPSAPDTGNLNV
ncbi:MAG: hypothetical protein J6S85_01220 [Methanobrevibacter sp.]|nr:hypothetical protein [Methanobrevibacter sp.]